MRVFVLREDVVHLINIRAGKRSRKSVFLLDNIIYLTENIRDT